MATELATAYVRIVPTTDGIEENLVKAMGTPSEHAGQKSGKAIAGGIAKGLAVGAAAVGTAAVTMVTGLVNGARSVAEYGDNVDKMSQKIGISAQAYQQWDYVMSRAGTSIDSMKAGMKTLSTQAQNNAEAFSALGISEEQVASMSSEELFTATIQGLASMEEGTERTALASQLLGRAGADMAPLFNEGTDAINEQLQMAEDYGMVMSDDMVKASATFQDSVTTMQGTLNGLKNRMLGEFLPAMTDVTDGLALLFTGDMSGLDSINAGIDAFIGKISDLLPKVIEVGGSMIVTLANAVIQNLPKLINSATSVVLQFVQAIVQSLPMVVNVALQLILSLVQGIGQALPTLIPAVVQVITTIVQTIVEALPTLVTAVIQLIEGIVQGIVAAIPVLMEAIPPIIEALLNALPQIITAICDGINTLIPMLIDGLILLINGIVAALPTILQALIAALPTILQAIIDGLIGNISTLIDGLITLVNGLVTAMPQIISALIEYLPDLVITVAATLVQNLPTLIQAVVQIIAGIVRALPGIFTTVISTTSQLVSQLAQKIASLASQFLAAAGQWVQNIWQGIVSGWGTITGGIGGLAQRVLSAIGSVFAGAASIGSNLARGLWNGLSSGWSWLTSQVTALANRLKNAVKNALGIHSPSTEMRWVGEMFNAGLAEGLGETGEVEHALTGVTGLLTDSIDPNLALSADLSASGAQNSTAATLGAILRVVDGLSDEIRNLKIYLDSGQLVGGIIGKTDESLGRRDALAARGGALSG